MPTFEYVATHRDGVDTKGSIKASDAGLARAALLGQGLIVRELGEKTGLLSLEVSPARIKPAELMHLSRQLAAFVRAGIPLFDAITELGEESDRRAIKRVLLAIAAELRAGSTLSDAVARHPKDFPNYYVGVLRSAELTGQLDAVLDDLATYVERDVEARRKLRTVLTYPIIVVVLAVGTIAVLTSFVLPQFVGLFAQMKVELPLPTRMLLAATDFIDQWWWLMLIIGITGFCGYLLAMRQDAGRRIRDSLLLRLPVVGPTIRCASVERFTRTMASLVSAGITLPEAIRVSSESLNNLVFESALTRACDEVISGAGLADPIARTKLFPVMAIQMIRVGESTGTLEDQLEVAAGFYASELDYKIKRLSTFFEPLIILVMGGLVGFVAVALISAMYGIFKAGNV